MTNWVIGKQVQLTLEKNKNGKVEYTSYRYEGTKSGFSSDTIKIKRYQDGALSFGDGEDFIYLYHEQVKHLRKILRSPEVIKKGKRK